MDEKLLFVIISSILSGIIGIFSIGIKSVLHKIKELEAKQDEFMEEEKIRLLFDDKTEGIKEQIADLKNSIERLHAIILADRK